MEALLAPGAPALRALAAAVGRQLAALPGGAAAPEFVPGVGPSAVDLSIVSSAARLRSALDAAAAFAREWRELGSAARHRLARSLLQPPLDAAAEAAAAGAAAAGALGAGTDRYAGGVAAAVAAAPPLPEGAERRDVLVRFPGGRRQRYVQVVLPATGARLCLHCAAAVPSGAAVPLAEALDTAALLFCSPECERRRAVTASSAAMRRALFKRERGVCILCGVDAAGLVRRLQAVERGSRRWRAARGALLDAAAPEFAARLSAKQREALIAHATQGAAWQADHEVPVYAGGGLCDVDNLRTLCTPCHSGVTAAQARARGGARRAAKAAAEGRARRRPAKRAAREYLSESE
jgi:5-methylcytosine-specific restriction endonuclease McrA